MARAMVTDTVTTIKRFRTSYGGKTAGAFGQKTKGKSMMPMLAELSGNLHVGLAAIGSAIGVGIIGLKAAEATGRNPGAADQIRNNAIIFAALAEGVVFFAIFLVK